MQTTFARPVLASPFLFSRSLARFLRGGVRTEQHLKREFELPKDIISIRYIGASDSLIVIPVATCQFDVILTPVEGGCILYTNRNSNQIPQEEECCCYEMEIRARPNCPDICKFQITMSDVGPFCCIDPWTYGWTGGIPDANGVLTLYNVDPVYRLRPDHPVKYRVCGRNKDEYVTICLKAYHCDSGEEYCSKCSDVIPANQVCTNWTPNSVENNKQFDESVILKAAYPNPSNQITSLSYTQKVDGIMGVAIFDPQGKIIKTTQQKGFSGNTYSVDVYVSELPEGAYFAKFNFNGFTRESKFIIKH